MTIAHIRTQFRKGIHIIPIQVEVHIAPGLPRIKIVGLAETALKESQERVRSAILQSGFFFPSKRLTINLSPADLPKSGSHFDLAIALAILMASGQLESSCADHYVFLGELGLSGQLHASPEILPLLLLQPTHDILFIVPHDLSASPGLDHCQLLTANCLSMVYAHLKFKKPLSTYQNPKPNLNENDTPPPLYLSDHQIQTLSLAAAGQHALCMIGPPGRGKSLIAQHFQRLLPSPNLNQQRMIYAMHELARQHYQSPLPPFRNPHHFISKAGLLGGGKPIQPGEVSLAHGGILFLDELPEFDRPCLEGLREPLETQHIHIARADQKVIYPAHFQLIVAMNPCPCGLAPALECRCTAKQIQQYQSRISRPLWDRLDMCLWLEKSPCDLFDTANLLHLSDLQPQIVAIQQHQQERDQCAASSLPLPTLQRYCQLSPAEQSEINLAFESSGWRAFTKTLRVARTLADLSLHTHIHFEHIYQAMQYRYSELPLQV